MLEQKQTAKFITQKIYKFYVNDNIDEEKITWLSNRFYQSNYNIASLMKDIFTGDWFYNEKNIAVKIKSPVELLVGIRKLLPMEIENPEIQLLFERALGQVLFYPPNVAGWPGGTNWIDSSSLMLRLQIPRLFKEDDEFSLSAKTDDDVQMGMREMYKKQMQSAIGNRYKIKTKINWEVYLNQFEQIKRENLLVALKQNILQTPVDSIANATLETNIDSSNRAAFIKSATISLISTPEYQMC